MSERCELCGAKARPEDETCRECGSPLSSPTPEPSESSTDITAVEPPPRASEWTEPGSVPPPAETNPELHYEEPAPRRGVPWIAVLGVAAALGVGALAYNQLSSDPPTELPATDPATTPSPPASDPAAAPEPAATPGCPELETLGGQWTFTTEVTGSRVVQSSGLNGFYTLNVDVENCVASAVLTKTGYTARMFSEARLQRASAQLEPGEGLREGLATAAFHLESNVGPHGIIEFSFTAQDDTLSGVYRQRGARWRDAGLTGFLRGVRDGDSPRELTAAEQPCAVRCHLACDTGVRDTLPAQSLRTCVEACTEDTTSPAQCGDIQPVPEAFALSLEGPSTFAKLCRGVGGCAKKIGRGHDQPPRLDAERLPNGWSDVKMVRAKKEGGVRLALHGAGGWWLSAPLFEASRGSRLGKLRLYARQLAEGTDRRYVLGLARTTTRDHSPEVYVACRLGDTPKCVRVPRARGAHVNALPEGTLAVDPATGDPSGVFSW